MTRIRVECVEGRTQEQRQKLVEAITDVFVEIVHVRPDQVTVIFQETPRHLQAKGGRFWSEGDLGKK